MLSPRESLGIAQVVFYAPAVPLAIYLFVRNIKIRPRMAWWPLIPLTLMRLAGGILTIVLEQRKHDSLGLIIAAIVLLNIGVVPLIVATLGQMRIILFDNYGDTGSASIIARLLRAAFVIAIALLATGGGLTSTNQNIAKILSLVGYIVFAVVLAALIVMELHFLRKRSELLPTSRKVLFAALAAVPFLIVRTVYGILETINQYDYTSTWSPLFGNIYAFAFMGLFMEYVCVCIYFWLGLSITRDRLLRHNAPRATEGYSSRA